MKKKKKMLGYIKKEKRHALKNSLLERPKQKELTQWASHGGMVEEQFWEKLSPPH